VHQTECLEPVHQTECLEQLCPGKPPSALTLSRFSLGAADDNRAVCHPQKKPRRSGPAPAGGRRLARHDFPECPRDSAMTALNSAATRGDQWGIWITDEAGRTGGVV